MQTFYLTQPAVCPYLPDQKERKIFTHVTGNQAQEINNILAHNGFRRSQTIAYRPACETCAACQSVRVLVDDFHPSPNMRRIISRNDDLIGTEISNRYTSEQYSLFQRYIEARHKDGGMAQSSVLDYRNMIEDSAVKTVLIEYRYRGVDSALNGRGQGDLIAVALTDYLNDGLSMVYTFFDPDLSDRSLGTFIILDHISRACKAAMPYLYLGYWISGSQKMDYKKRFMPQERLVNNRWEPVIPFKNTKL